ncbi:MAG: alpha/beta hydrolase [Alphaproteobacteria bacterium]
MRPDDYPPQEPFSKIGALYHETVMALPSPPPALEVRHGDDPYQGIAIYAAERPSGIVLCVIHGGGWTNGYKEWMAFMAPGLVARGVTMVSLGYRLAPQHVYPAGLEDCMAGVALARDRVAAFGGDPDRMFVGGHSAGGHYASLLALMQDWQAPRAIPADPIKGALPISGTYYFGPDSGLSMRPRFLGEESAERDAAASPMRHVHGAAPPFLVAWGERDFPHLVRQSQEFAAALEHEGVEVERTQLDDCDHLGASYASGVADGAWIDRAASFMSRHA